MHITINTDNVSDLDRAILAMVLGEAPTVAAAAAVTEASTPAAVEEEKPKRTRRSPAQKKADDEAEAAKAAAGDPAEEPTSENAESGPTIEEVTALATDLIKKDRPKMVELLNDFVQGNTPKRVANVPADKLAEFREAILKALAED